MLRRSIYILTTALCFTVAGCTAVQESNVLVRTEIETSNPYLARGEDFLEPAKVYFIRPMTERRMGAADNLITIDINRNRLLKIDKGEYTLVDLKPNDNVEITINSITAWGTTHEIKEVSKTRRFSLESGQTYFISAKMVDGEFRGVYFLPKSIDLETAKKITKRLRPIGDNTKASPLSSL